MKVALYARISTSEERQNLDTQLMPLREFCAMRQVYHHENLEVYKEYTDTASARDIAHRLAWRELLSDAAKHRFQSVLVFKLDRAFRSVKDMHDTLSIWETEGISFRSIREEFNTGTAAGRLLMNLLASLAEFELELIRERVKAGMDRAAKTGTRSGKPIGRRPLTIPLRSICATLVETKNIALAAKTLKCSRAYIYKVLAEVNTNPKVVIKGDWTFPS